MVSDKINKILILGFIISILLSGFSIRINEFEFQWLGLLGTICEIIKNNKRKKDWPVEKFENFGTKIYLYSTFNYKETIN